jgi:hypothetical protein
MKGGWEKRMVKENEEEGEKEHTAMVEVRCCNCFTYMKSRNLNETYKQQIGCSKKKYAKKK